MRLRERSFRRLCAALLFLSAGSARADGESVTLLYYDRPPFHYSGRDHKPAGSVVDVTERALAAAGLSFTWEIRPAKRVLAEVFEGRADICAPSWFHTPEREEKALFSDALMPSPPMVGVVRLDTLAKTSPDAGATFAAMTSILVRDHLTHGSYFGGLLAAQEPGHVGRRTNTDIPSMLATVAAGHADLAMMTEEEADFFLPTAAPGLTIVRFANTGPLESRYLLCSKRTDPALIARINAALNN